MGEKGKSKKGGRGGGGGGGGNPEQSEGYTKTDEGCVFVYQPLCTDPFFGHGFFVGDVNCCEFFVGMYMCFCWLFRFVEFLFGGLWCTDIHTHTYRHERARGRERDRERTTCI
jgi:hypothetical protein